MSRRGFVAAGCAFLLSSPFLIASGVTYSARVEPGWVEVVQQDVVLPRLPATLDGLSVAHLSDLHLGPYVSAERIRQAVEITNSLAPDLVALTGDFIYRSSTYSAPVAEELAALSPRHGVHAVLGNHDVWNAVYEMPRRLAERGISVLRDERLRLEVDGEALWLLGIEDRGHSGSAGGSFASFSRRWRSAGEAARRLLEDVPPEEPRLLLAHNPDFTEMLPPGEVDLALCGHTHGGQVRLPLIGAPIVPSVFGQKYVSGLVQGPATQVYVTRGIGVTPPPVRFRCRPEVTLLLLRSSS